MRTTDFVPSGSRHYTVARLGAKRSLTPEGYLLCEDVPVGRTGDMLYHEGELQGEDGELIKGGPDGIVRVTRGPEDLFRPETIASFEGKPVTLSHPDEFVSPETFAAYARGTMVNVRRGTGIEDDLLFADLLITGGEAIRAVQEDGIEEVSLGYDADYQPLEPGRAAQRNIVGNHVAIVKRGRCGPRCAIGDEEMAGKKKQGFLDRIMGRLNAKDEAELEKIAKEVEAEDEDPDDDDEDGGRKKTNDALSRIEKSLRSLDERLEKLESEDDDEEEPDGETNDTVLHAESASKLDEAGVKLYTGDAAVVIPALAEIIAPGTRMHTLDAQTTDAQRAATLCACQRKALDTAYRTEDGRAVIEPLLGGMPADFQKMPPLALNAIFHGAAHSIRVRNNAEATRGTVPTRDFGKTTTVADINAQNRKFWDEQRKR